MCCSTVCHCDNRSEHCVHVQGREDRAYSERKRLGLAIFLRRLFRPRARPMLLALPSSPPSNVMVDVKFLLWTVTLYRVQKDGYQASWG